MPPETRRLVLTALTLVLALCFWHYGVRDLTYFDEPRYAGVAKEMVDAGSWVLPRLYDEPYLEKPPLWFWTAGLLANAFGWNSYALFLPNVLAHCLTALLVLDLGRRTLSTRAGAYAAIAYALCPLVLRNARSAQLDVMLVFGESLTAWGGILALKTGRARYGFAAALGFGVASLVKGHIALFGLLAPLAWCHAHRDWSFVKRARWIGFALLGLVPILVWLGALVHAIGLDEVRAIFQRQIVERTGGENHHSPFPVGPEYLGALAAMLPLLILVPGAVRGVAASVERRAYFTWALVFFTIFALVPSKREIYLLPLAVPLALLAGARVRDLAGGAPATTWERRALVGVGALVLLGALAIPVFLAVHEAFSADAALVAVAGIVAGAPFVRAARAGSERLAPCFLMLLACVSVFAEPALGHAATTRFDLRRFGASIRAAVPPDESVHVLEITKAFAVRYFGERKVDFIDEVKELDARLPATGTAYIVCRANDVEDVRAAGFTAEEIDRERRTEPKKAFTLLRVHR